MGRHFLVGARHVVDRPDVPYKCGRRWNPGAPELTNRICNEMPTPSSGILQCMPGKLLFHQVDVRLRVRTLPRLRRSCPSLHRMAPSNSRVEPTIEVSLAHLWYIKRRRAVRTSCPLRSDRNKAWVDANLELLTSEPEAVSPRINEAVVGRRPEVPTS